MQSLLLQVKEKIFSKFYTPTERLMYTVKSSFSMCI